MFLYETHINYFIYIYYMVAKSIKLSDETYRRLVELAGKLQAERGEPVSIEEAIRYLMKKEITPLAGSWDVTDEEAEKLRKSLTEGWAKWRKSA